MTRALLEPARLEAARKAMDLGLCDPCLGRRFAKVETGLTNGERGAIVREAVGATQVSYDNCHVCRGLFADLDLFADVAVETLSPYEIRHFLVGSRVDPALEEREKDLNASLAITESAERIQSELNREIGKRVAAKSGKVVEFKNPDIAVIVDTRFLDAEMQMGGLYIFGRYRKLSREIPQTRWPCRRCGGRGCVNCDLTGKQYQTSVEEFVAKPFLAATGATAESFHGAGREDIDARALGTGRPFILELKDPRVRTIDLSGFPALVVDASNGEVEMDSLRFADKAEVAAIKEHRGEKTYRALVDFEKPVDPATLEAARAALQGVNVHQRTPERVQHRRADLVRERRVIDIQVESHDGAVATLVIRGDAGLYIKELVSGDEGRTEPSLSGILGINAKVRDLDILDVQYERAEPAVKSD